MHHVTRPDEMIAAQVFVALRLTPGNRERSDRRPRIGLVLVGEQQTVARVMEPATVRRLRPERLDRPACVRPMRDETRLMLREREAERLEERGQRVVE